jgi:hypothetical protein
MMGAIQMPLVARSRTPAAQLMGIGLPKCLTPIPHSRVRQDDAALGHELFDIPIAQAETEVQPHAVANDLGWEAMAFVGIGSKSCGHAASMPHKARAEEVANLI